MANTEKLGDLKDTGVAGNAKHNAHSDKLGDTNGEKGKLARFYSENERVFNGIGIGILIVAILAVVYFKVLAPKWNGQAAEAAQPAIASAVQNGTLSTDTATLKAALDGNKDMEGFLSVIESYDHPGLKTARAAKFSLKYYAALCYMNMGQNDDALDLLLQMKKRDDYLWYESQMLIGDLYDDKGEVDNAKKYYEKAIKGETDFVAPIALWKMGMLCQREGNWSAAYDYYNTIKENYYERYQGMGVAKYYERAKIKAGK